MTKLISIDGSKSSSLCFGCMQFGGTADNVTSQAMFERCRAKGVNFFDTAHTYNDGASERYLGDFIKPERDKLIVASKAAYTGGGSKSNVLLQFDESRQRLGVDVIDILYLHRWDPEVSLHETFDTLCELQCDGKIRYIGVSNFAAWQVMKAQAVAIELGTRIDILQPMYSLVKRQAEVELFPMALSEGFAVASYSPLAAGLLTGKYHTGGSGRLSTDKRYAARYGPAWMQETATALSEMSKEVGIECATLAVAWAAQHPAVTAPIISARNAKQLEASLAAQTVKLADEHFKRISDFSITPAPATDRLEERAS